MGSANDNENLLGRYLRARRELVRPEQAGLPAGGNRRVRGLRREEVALLAGISADYYLRLERGRDKNPSPQVLEALARVLLLDEVEQRYLLGLTAPRPRRQPRRRPELVPARLHHLLAAVQVPAFVEGRAFDVLAANSLATALSPRPRSGNRSVPTPTTRDSSSSWASFPCQAPTSVPSGRGTTSAPWKAARRW